MTEKWGKVPTSFFMHKQLNFLKPFNFWCHSSQHLIQWERKAESLRSETTTIFNFQFLSSSFFHRDNLVNLICHFARPCLCGGILNFESEDVLQHDKRFFRERWDFLGDNAQHYYHHEAADIHCYVGGLAISLSHSSNWCQEVVSNNFNLN